MVGDKVEEVKWKGLGVIDHWKQMKGIMMETAQDICGMTNGPPRHKETSLEATSMHPRICTPSVLPQSIES